MNILFISGNSQSTDTFSKQMNSPKLKEHQISVFDLEAAISSLSRANAFKPHTTTK